MAHENLDSLIGSLAQDLKPVKPLPHPLVRIIPLVLFSLLYISAIITYVGFRVDLGLKLQDSIYLFEIGFVSLVALNAVLVSALLGVPDARGAGWFVFSPLVMAGAFVLWSVGRGLLEGFYMPHFHWDACLTEIVAMSVIPALGLGVMTYYSNTTRPRLLAVVHTITVAAIGYVGLRLTCPVDTVGHTAVHHLIPFMILGTVLGFTARRVYKW
jgi:hypothetical protein